MHIFPCVGSTVRIDHSAARGCYSFIALHAAVRRHDRGSVSISGRVGLKAAACGATMAAKHQGATEAELEF